MSESQNEESVGFASRERPRPSRLSVGIAEYAVTDEGTALTTSGLGSCVAVSLFDRVAGVAGLIHVMLPSAGEGADAKPAKYADTGVELLYDEVVAAGATPARLEAKLVGGSHMFEFSGGEGRIGTRNVEAVHASLSDLGVPVVDEDVGGTSGRSVRIDGETGAVSVRQAGAEVTSL